MLLSVALFFVNSTCKTFSLPTADWNYSCGANIAGNVARNVHKDPGSVGMDGFQMHPACGSGEQIKGAIQGKHGAQTKTNKPQKRYSMERRWGKSSATR